MEIEIHKLYLCNGKRCGENHDCGECHHTHDVDYSQNGDFNCLFEDDKLITPNNIKVEKDGNKIFLIEQEAKMKKIITVDEAIKILPKGNSVHTFVNIAMGLVGADWSKEDIIDKLKAVDTIEISGDHARNMGHGLVAYNSDARLQSDLLFIETDKEKLDKFDPPKEGNKE